MLVCEWMKRSCDYELTNFSSDAWNGDMNKVCNSFFKDKRKLKLFLWIDKAGIKCSGNLPPTKKEHSPLDGEFAIFLKTRPDGQDVEITMDNVGETIYTKLMNVDDNMKSLLKHMNQLLPNFLKDFSWPENIKKDFLSTTHKLLSQLTEEVFLREGTTKLYIPNEEIDENASQQDKKDQIQRLEACLIFWCR